MTYLQITPRSRSDIREYADMERRIDETVGRVNGHYGEAAWTPIRYVNRPYSRTTLAGLYRSSRAALVTPLRDGMNLVAKEYVAAQDPEDPGVLILSRFAGAAVECQAALLVNPYDQEAVAAAIDQALSMPLDERRARHGSTGQGAVGERHQALGHALHRGADASGAGGGACRELPAPASYLAAAE